MEGHADKEKEKEGKPDDGVDSRRRRGRKGTQMKKS